MTKLLILQMVSSKLIQWNSNKNGIKKGLLLVNLFLYKPFKFY